MTVFVDGVFDDAPLAALGVPVIRNSGPDEAGVSAVEVVGADVGDVLAELQRQGVTVVDAPLAPTVTAAADPVLPALPATDPAPAPVVCQAPVCQAQPVDLTSVEHQLHMLGDKVASVDGVVRNLPAPAAPTVCGFAPCTPTVCEAQACNATPCGADNEPVLRALTLLASRLQSGFDAVADRQVPAAAVNVDLTPILNRLNDLRADVDLIPTDPPAPPAPQKRWPLWLPTVVVAVFELARIIF